uniref:L-type lectin-like domain-containing protein n=1 Tax=Chromera velia CCMP2878 TaxID=1169474 RepID=A0A0G4FFP7_9ALVE|eukprot:Cvel_16729.t1-p1 / transcript=Cvel_16729.t1 / gene=Cvel_16729 / organism=Chromera_velia_CCMP2878 / gene_product=hypothetical protein / transcript_product=hypothetical protein / location=Cvel_scaffold1301:23788-26841(+) / protein_length=699 / sequence_SO=supercontig / SO=protein_coding / is_pseudo=false
MRHFLQSFVALAVLCHQATTMPTFFTSSSLFSGSLEGLFTRFTDSFTSVSFFDCDQFLYTSPTGKFDVASLGGSSANCQITSSNGGNLDFDLDNQAGQDDELRIRPVCDAGQFAVGVALFLDDTSGSPDPELLVDFFVKEGDGEDREFRSLVESGSDTFLGIVATGGINEILLFPQNGQSSTNRVQLEQIDVYCAEDPAAVLNRLVVLNQEIMNIETKVCDLTNDGAIDLQDVIGTLQGSDPTASLTAIHGKINSLTTTVGGLSTLDTTDLDGVASAIQGTSPITLTDLDGDLDTVHGKINSLTTTVGGLSTLDTTDLDGVTSAIQGTSPITLTDLDGDLDTVHGKINSLTTTVGGLSTLDTTDLDGVTSAIQGTSPITLTDLDGDLDTVHGKINSLTTTVGGLSTLDTTDLDGVTSAIQGTSPITLSELDGDLTTIHGKINTLSNDLATLSMVTSDGVTGLATDIQGDSPVTLSSLDADLEIVHSKLETLGGNIESLSMQTTNEIRNATAELQGDSDTTLTSLSNDLESVHTKVDSLAEEVADLKMMVAEGFVHMEASFTQTDALLRIVRRMLLTDAKFLPGFNGEHSCKDAPDACPLPPAGCASEEEFCSSGVDLVDPKIAEEKQKKGSGLFDSFSGGLDLGKFAPQGPDLSGLSSMNGASSSSPGSGLLNLDRVVPTGMPKLDFQNLLDGMTGGLP